MSTPAQLRQRGPAGWADYSPLQQPLLVLDAQHDDGDAELLHVLRTLPVPTIALGHSDTGLSGACDVRVADAAAAAPLCTAIRRHPLAASIGMQLLRLQQDLPLEAALQAESLAYATLQGGSEFQQWLIQHRPAAPAVALETDAAVLLQREGPTLHIELNRPSLRNSMSVAMRDALLEALQLVLADDSITQVQLRGRGKCFSVGGELSEFGSAPDTASAHAIRSIALPGRLLAACAARVEVHLHGACIGSGIEFPAFAGRVFARRDAWFQLPELQFGLLPGAGGTVSIARRIGRQRLAWLMLSGRRIDADTALQWGLVDALLD